MTDQNRQFTVSLADSFFSSLQTLSKTAQEKTFDAVRRFQKNPTAAGRNLEKISNQMLSVRIDLAYRAILTQFDGDNFIWLWVDHHDAAYKWASRRKIAVANQIFQVIRTEEKVETAEPVQPRGMFGRFSAAQLGQLGVVAEQLPLVYSLQSEEDLGQHKAEFHPGIFEGLVYLAGNVPLAEILEMQAAERQAGAAEQVSALDSAQSKQTLVRLNEQLDLATLQEMLDQPLEAWRLFLHASQRRLVEADFNGPAKVLGGAGTGKSVVAVHRAGQLAERLRIDPDKRVLLTTFTVNLAGELADMLEKICLPTALQNIDVLNIDKLITKLFQKAFPEYQIAYSDAASPLWEQAITQNQYKGKLPADFFKDEWARVLVPQNVTNFQEYLKADRTGRGTRLSRPEKALAWSVFSSYKDLMEQKGLVDITLATSMLTKALQEGQFKVCYHSIVVDEAQDFSRQALMFLRALTGPEHANDLFLVGDANQRIYRNLANLSQCGIRTRGRSHVLRINYRTTEQIRRWACRLCQDHTADDLDGQAEDGRGYISLTSGPEPELTLFKTADEEIERILALIEEHSIAVESDRGICLAVRTNRLLQQYKKALTENGVRLYEIKQNNQDLQDIAGVRIATMHRVKGLEFDHMILAAVNDNIVPYRLSLESAPDSIAKKEALAHERALLYVAATRARKTLHVLSHGRPSRFLENG